MAKHKNGALTGYYDIRHNDICIGDYIKTGTSAFKINQYGMPQNPIVGTRKWVAIGDIELIDEAEYRQIIAGRTPAPAQPETPEVIDLEEPDEIKEAVKETEEASAPSEEQTPADITRFSDDELRAELAARGYRGTVTHTYTVTVTDTLEL